MKPYFFKVNHINGSGETYIGIYLVFGLDTRDALERLSHDKTYFERAGSIPGILHVDQIDANQAFEEFRNSVFEINYDCYN